MSDFKAAELFNCCTEYREPNWSRYTRLEIGGCINDPSLCAVAVGDDPETYTVGGIAFMDAEFFTVYGRNSDDEAEAITDVQGTMCDALAVAIELGKRSGKLPISLYEYC